MVSAQIPHVIETLEKRRLLAANLVADHTGIYPTDAVVMGGAYYFAAADDAHGQELWRSDGTPEGTRLVKDVRPGPDSAGIEHLTVLNGQLLFLTHGGDNILRLWRSDGTADGTVELALVGAHVTTGIFPSAVVNGHFVFLIHGGVRNPVVKLWSTDGSLNGTSSIADVYFGPDGNHVFDMHTSGNRAVFTTLNGQLWSTDGTTAGTFTIAPPANFGDRWPTHPQNTTSAGGLVFFYTSPDDAIWRTDGTADGTRLVKALPSHASGLQPFGDRLFFEVSDASNSASSAWLSDGTEAGTRAVASFPGVLQSRVAVLGDRMIAGSFVHNPWRSQLVVSNGAAGGTSIIPLANDYLYYSQLKIVGGAVFFVTNNAGTGDVQLWRTDGTADGTGVVQTLADRSILAGAVTFEEANGLLAVTPFNGDPTSTFFIDPADATGIAGPIEARTRLLDGVLRVFGTRGDDRIRIYRVRDNDQRVVVNLNGVKRSFALADVRRIHIYGYSGNDNFLFDERFGKILVRSRIWAGAGDDTVTTGWARDTIYGDAGDDRLASGNNSDSAFGGGGDDSINAGAGNDTAAGDAGADNLIGGAGNDLLSGGNGPEHDTLDGNAGADVLFGTAVYEIFFAGKPGQDPLDEILLW